MGLFGKLLGRLKGDGSGSSQSDAGVYVPPNPVNAPINEASVALRYISARYHGRKTPSISHLRGELRSWLMSLDADVTAQIYGTVRNNMVPLRKILTGAYNIDGSRGDGTPPWAESRQVVADRIVHAGRVYVLDDHNSHRLSDEDAMAVDRLADLLLDRITARLEGSSPVPRRQLMH